MSHDQKPAKMRLTAGGGAPAAVPPARRRGDVVIDNGASPAGASGGGIAAAAPTAPVRGGTGRAMLAVLFLLGCVAGGVALPLMGWM